MVTRRSDAQQTFITAFGDRLTDTRDAFDNPEDQRRSLGTVLALELAQRWVDTLPANATLAQVGQTLRYELSALGVALEFARRENRHPGCPPIDTFLAGMIAEFGYVEEIIQRITPEPVPDTPLGQQYGDGFDEEG